MSLVLKNLSRSIQRASELQERVARDDVLEPIGRDLAQRTRDRAPVGRTGRFRRNIVHEVRNGKLRIGMVKGYYMGFIWRFLEFGTERHPIIAKRQRTSQRTGRRTRSRRGALVLASGEQVFGPRVHHPGTRPKPFIRPVIDEARARITRTLIGELRKAARFR